MAEDFLKRFSDRYWLSTDSDEAAEFADLIAESFDVSMAAARVRLKKLGFLQEISFESDHAFDDAEYPFSKSHSRTG